MRIGQVRCGEEQRRERGERGKGGKGEKKMSGNENRNDVDTNITTDIQKLHRVVG